MVVIGLPHPKMNMIIRDTATILPLPVPIFFLLGGTVVTVVILFVRLLTKKHFDNVVGFFHSVAEIFRSGIAVGYERVAFLHAC